MVLEREKTLMGACMVGTLRGLTKPITELADLPALSLGIGLRNLAKRICTFFELSIESARLGNSSSGSRERRVSGTEWIANWTSLGTRRKGSQGEFPTRKERLS